MTGQVQEDKGGQQAPPIGLSIVHIPSESPGGYHGHVKGKFRDTAEGRFCHGPTEVPFQHPTGSGEITDGDRLYTARRWRDGISIGDLPILERKPDGKHRGNVTVFTGASRCRMVRYLKECEANYRYMGTLTVGGEYSRDPADFRAAVDRWLVGAMRLLRSEYERKGQDPGEASIFWWVEFQSRGAPHLHCYYTIPVKWQKLAKLWGRMLIRFKLCANYEQSRVWRTSTRFEKIRAGYRGVIAYARKYAIKMEQKQEVEGVLEGGWKGRFWGVRGMRTRGSCHIMCTGRSRGARAFSRMRKWLEVQVDRGLLVKYCWEYGQGTTYYLVNGRQWADVKEGEELDAMLREVIQLNEQGWGGSDADSMR